MPGRSNANRPKTIGAAESAEVLLEFIEYLDGLQDFSGETMQKKPLEEPVPADPAKVAEDGTIIMDGQEYVEMAISNAVEKEPKGVEINTIDRKIIEWIEAGHFKAQEEHHFEVDSHLFDCDRTQCPSLYTDLKDMLDSLADDITKLPITGRTRLTMDSAVAFYRPYHSWRSQWGIFFLVDRIAAWASSIFTQASNRPFLYGNNSITQIYTLVKVMVFYHEMYHHKIEAFATKAEIFMRQRYYTNGFQCFYCLTYGTDNCLEEAFANLYAFRRTIKYFAGNNAMDKQYVEKILRGIVFPQQPPGYRLATGLAALNENDAGILEKRFLDILWSYSYRVVNARPLPPMPASLWRGFTYAIDSVINTDNRVTYLIPRNSPFAQQVRGYI